MWMAKRGMAIKTLFGSTAGPSDCVFVRFSASLLAEFSHCNVSLYALVDQVGCLLC